MMTLFVVRLTIVAAFAFSLSRQLLAEIFGVQRQQHQQQQSTDHELWTMLLEAAQNHQKYGLIPHGVPGTEDFRLYFRDASGPISPFHDIPLHVDENNNNGLFHMVVEIPRWTNAKFEISNTEVLNPIWQGSKNGTLRFVSNLFPHHGYMWNYGAFPQTWENKFVLDEVTGFPGDNDPLDILEIGSRVATVGEVLKVKVIGALGLIDQGETDWKILVIDVNDKLANEINDVCDISEHFPGLLEATRNWLRDYKLPDGKEANVFAEDGNVLDKDFALGILNRTHEHWRRLVMDPTIKTTHSRLSVTQENSPFKLPRSAVMGFTMSPASSVTTLDFRKPGGDSWFFLPRENDDFGQNCSTESLS